jgi:hypothetical protein
MSDWLTQTNYSMMVIQVIVTLVLVPILSYSLLLSTANNCGTSHFPNASDNVKLWLKRASRQYWSVVAITLLIAGELCHTPYLITASYYIGMTKVG